MPTVQRFIIAGINGGAALNHSTATDVFDVMEVGGVPEVDSSNFAADEFIRNRRRSGITWEDTAHQMQYRGYRLTIPTSSKR